MENETQESNWPNRIIIWSKELANHLIVQLIVILLISVLGPALIGWLTGEWAWAAFVTLLLIPLLVLGYRHYRLSERYHHLRQRLTLIRQSERALQSFLKMDDSLLRLLASAVPSGPSDAQCKQVLRELLRDFSEVIGKDLSRGMVLLPHRDNYLRPFVGYEMAEETLLRTEFYIGRDADSVTRRPGVGGQAFVTRQIIIVHLEEHEGYWQADHPEYLDFD
jgi:hypothetical protein